jgi:hypothetical protein
MHNNEVRSSESWGARKVKGSRQGGVGVGHEFGGTVESLGVRGVMLLRAVVLVVAIVGLLFALAVDISQWRMQGATDIAGACQGNKELERRKNYIYKNISNTAERTYDLATRSV